MKTTPAYRVYWARITFPAFFNGQWGRLAAGAALAAIGALIAVLFFNLGRASAIAERAYQVELARGTNADRDPFATQLRVEHRDEPSTTDTTGETR
jgi:hypothetical protein